MFTPDVEDQAVLLLEGVEAECALVVVHQVGEGVLQLPDEMSAEVSLQVVEVGRGLLTDLALQVKVALGVQRLLLGGRSRGDGEGFVPDGGLRRRQRRPA